MENVNNERMEEIIEEGFKKYIKDYVSDALDALDGNDVRAAELVGSIMEYDFANGAVFTSTNQSRAFIKGFWNEAAETQKYYNEELEMGLNAFEEPDQFALLMVNKGVRELLNESPILSKNWDRLFTLSEELICEIKSELGIEFEYPSQLAYETDNYSFSIQKTEGGYDYSIYDAAHKLMDGGVLENEEISIFEAMDEIIGDCGIAEMEDELLLENRATAKVVDYDDFQDKVYEANKISVKEESALAAIKAKGTSTEKSGDERTPQKDQER